MNPTGKGGWAKGQSGNPNGRPRKAHSMTEAIARLLDAKGKDGVLVRDAVAAKLTEMALGGDIVALKYVCDRLDGHPAQALEHSGPEGERLGFKVIIGGNSDQAKR